MSFINSWPVFARQIALILTPLLLNYAISRLSLPQSVADAISAPLMEILELMIVPVGGVVLGWVVILGQRREQTDAKIEAVAELPEVRKVEVKSDALADSLGPKVVS